MSILFTTTLLYGVNNVCIFVCLQTHDIPMHFPVNKNSAYFSTYFARKTNYLAAILNMAAILDVYNANFYFL